MGAVYRREMQSYFFTPAAYVFLGVFLTLGGIFFGVGNLAARSGNLLMLLAQLSYLWVLLTPVLTMRLIAGERRSGTDRMLYASPCTLTGMVLGKYLAACTVILLTVALTGVYPLLVAAYGTLYFGETAAAYLGLLLQGCAFAAMDLLLSCFARSQMTAALVGVGVNLVMWLADVLADASAGLVRSALNFLSLYQRFASFVRGQLSLSSLLYYVLFIFIMLFLSVRALDARRWSEAQS